MKRIEVYLGEDEVSDQVSSIKKDASAPILLGPDEEGLGLRNATLKWNEVEEKKEGDEHSKSVTSSSSANTADSPSDDASTIISTENENIDHKFELKDISVIFPDGKLSVITGPTASGKTALLVLSHISRKQTASN